MAYVYIYRSGTGDVFKIGKATNLAKRKAALVTGNPEPLTEFDIIETDYASQCETYLHHRLRTKRSKRSEATEFFEVDPDELRALIADARHYAEKVLPMMEETERLSEQTCEDRVLVPTGDVLDTYNDLVRVREQYDTLGFEKDHLEARLKLTIGNASGIERVAEWKNVMQLRLNGDLLKAERPDIFMAYQRPSSFRRFTLL